ncbi:Uma2 family endonuclease [Streptomyces phyllanthi]|uniref:Uma2 family endonuclease n=2 Tax=Streptomyces phyllanthi TaxID=1803180 RepID=A0A5N8WDS4_9ACTN|nr:Uma2 family endonuclease [Streptomyces phyllanthi]
MLTGSMKVIDGDYVKADDEWDELVRVWEQTDVPKGCKVEIIEGLITVTPRSPNAHHYIAGRIQRRLYEVIREHWGIYQRLGAAVPSRLGLYVPDLLVVPEEELSGDDCFIPAGEAELVMEITSKATAANDRTHKAAGYAAAGIPLYLLIDSLTPDGPTITLYGEPKGDHYRPLGTAKFGEALKLPAPFDLVIDTSEFPGD